ncbi:MAG: hypothetical protein OQK35_03800 [Alphaproteobacteria bacterium]|nr:hypothetical protein [Rhodospirillales bacterium]MCW9045437.1 hypothetical protein [Alphaproteobacteria bacterium]
MEDQAQPSPAELVKAALDANPAVNKALRPLLGDLEAIQCWFDVTEALSKSGKVQEMAKAFLGNKSERLILAAILRKADFAHVAQEVSPNFWIAWGGLDYINKSIVLEILDDERG